MQVPLGNAAPQSPVAVKAARDLRQDFPNLRRFAQANVDLGPLAAGQRRVVFLGDSITEYWARPGNGFPTTEGYINRGIGGQTTQQMLLRFRQDVVNLNPRAVVILAGTNDIAANTGMISVADIENNLISMLDIARANNISVVLCTVLPAARYPWRPEIEPVAKIVELNAWMRQYAAQRHIGVVDLYAAMANPDGSMKKDLSNEGVHPNAAGYAVMKPLIDTAIRLELETTPTAISRR